MVDIYTSIFNNV